MADGLSLLLEEKVEQGAISPIRVCHQAPGISHLLFADDTLLFFKADLSQSQAIKEVFGSYATSTGQLINPTKCSILFGNSLPIASRDAITNCLQIASTEFEDKYLGLPTPGGRMHKGRFQSLRERIWKKILQWGENYLSSGGKEVLIKAVIQAIPVYVMGIFKLPESVCEDLTSLTRNFWWGAEKGKRKTHWKAWKSLTKSKSLGGLGFKDIRLFNQALLARQAWRLIDNPDSLCARVLKAKYYPNGSIVDTSFGGNASPGWQAIEHGLELVKKGIIWRIGNGRSVRVWQDPWLPRDLSRRPITPKNNCRIKWVADLMLDNGMWDANKINQIFLPVDVEIILKLRTSSRDEEDFIAWHPDKLGNFSVRTAYRLAENWAKEEASSSSSDVNIRKAWELLWKCNVPSKVKIFTWRATSNCLPTWDNKKKRNLEISDTCVICGMEKEDTMHALCRCPQAKHLWLAMKESNDLSLRMDDHLLGPSWLFNRLALLPDHEQPMFLMVLWRIWFVHNEIIHGKPSPSIEASQRFLQSYMKSLLEIKQHP